MKLLTGRWWRLPGVLPFRSVVIPCPSPNSSTISTIRCPLLSRGPVLHSTWFMGSPARSSPSPGEELVLARLNGYAWTRISLSVSFILLPIATIERGCYFSSSLGTLLWGSSFDRSLDRRLLRFARWRSRRLLCNLRSGRWALCGCTILPSLLVACRSVNSRPLDLLPSYSWRPGIAISPSTPLTPW